MHIADDRFHGFVAAVTIPDADHIAKSLHDFLTISIGSLDGDGCGVITVPAVLFQRQHQFHRIEPVLRRNGHHLRLAGEDEHIGSSSARDTVISPTQHAARMGRQMVIL